jgi:hypothetical protein
MRKLEKYVFSLILQIVSCWLFLKADNGETEDETTTTKSPPSTAESKQINHFQFYFEIIKLTQTWVKNMDMEQ